MPFIAVLTAIFAKQLFEWIVIILMAFQLKGLKVVTSGLYMAMANLLSYQAIKRSIAWQIHALFKM